MWTRDLSRWKYWRRFCNPVNTLKNAGIPVIISTNVKKECEEHNYG